MKVGVLAAIVAALSTATGAPSALAQPGQDAVCPSYGYTYGDGAWEGAAAPGITIAVSGEGQVTVSVASGYTLTRFCYQMEQGDSGATSVEAPIVGPAVFAIGTTQTGGTISHITVETSVAPPPPTKGAPSTLTISVTSAITITTPRGAKEEAEGKAKPKTKRTLIRSAACQRCRLPLQT
ncbi:MAG: hypothetical protein H0V45_07930 [Actinobacteria bacterium]|nr:hypothetical protein [Actinomycetota bacterium]